ncbi:hypothetical protein IWZ00DRAFT_515122 [Phyllosticta capitalensis]
MSPLPFFLVFLVAFLTAPTLLFAAAVPGMAPELRQRDGGDGQQTAAQGLAAPFAEEEVNRTAADAEKGVGAVLFRVVNGISCLLSSLLLSTPLRPYPTTIQSVVSPSTHHKLTTPCTNAAGLLLHLGLLERGCQRRRRRVLLRRRLFSLVFWHRRQ